MDKADFVIVGSSGGGGTIAWLLAKAGFRVAILEVGEDWSTQLHDRYDPIVHDEYRFRVARPEVKRRLRGDYNTYRKSEAETAVPKGFGWTASMLGGGSVIWGAWSFRPLPIDLVLGTHFEKTGQADQLKQENYSVANWPVTYADFEPYFNLAEAILSVCGDRNETNKSVAGSSWYGELSAYDHFGPTSHWQPRFPFPNPPYPKTAVGAAVQKGIEDPGLGWTAARLPSGMVAPGETRYSTRAGIAEALKYWPEKDRPSFWRQPVESIWSNRLRDPCNMCGYCGEYLCWGKNGPKSGSLASTIAELRDMPNVEIILNAKAFEVVCDKRQGRATGVRYLDVTDPNGAVAKTQSAGSVIVACGAVQSARLLHMSSPRNGLVNPDQIGRYVTFHLFGLGSTYVLPPAFEGLLHGEHGHTGNMMTFEPYFVRDDARQWLKAGTLVTAAKKNPMDNAIASLVERKKLKGKELLLGMESYDRTLEIRLTGDDLPMAKNRVDLDPTHVDEYGLPVARITRDFGPAETRMFKATRKMMEQVWKPYLALKETNTPASTDANRDLIGDHQMGTCRMGEDPTTSVVDPWCRVHGVSNLYVVDSSFMPTGLGLNPMVSVVANALRVGSWIVQEAGKDADVR